MVRGGYRRIYARTRGHDDHARCTLSAQCYTSVMANQQLVDYIKSQLAAGVTKQDLQKAITAAGWSMQDSNEGFMSAEGKVPPVPEAPKTPAPPLQPMPVNIAPVSRPAAVVKPRFSPTIDTPRSLAWLWILLGVVVFVAVAAAAYVYVPTVRDVVDFYLGRGTVAVPPASGADTTPPAASATTTASSTQSQTSTTSSTTVKTSVGASTTAQ